MAFSTSNKNHMNLLASIEAALPSLSTSERRVGQFCIDNPNYFINTSVSKIAFETHVSKPTVMRFCRSVGFEGIADFREKLSIESTNGTPHIHKTINREDKPESVRIKIIDDLIASVYSYRNSSKNSAFELAAEVMHESYEARRKIVFFGIGSSGIVANDAQNKLFRLGINTSSVTDSHFQTMCASTLSTGDCLILVSNSGRTRDLVEACKIANNNTATTIAITTSGSPLSYSSKILLPADHNEGFDEYSPAVSRMMHLLTIDILITCFSLKLELTPIDDKLKAMRENIQHKKYY